MSSCFCSHGVVWVWLVVVGVRPLRRRVRRRHGPSHPVHSALGAPEAAKVGADHSHPVAWGAVPTGEETEELLIQGSFVAAAAALQLAARMEECHGSAEGSGDEPAEEDARDRPCHAAAETDDPEERADDAAHDHEEESAHDLLAWFPPSRGDPSNSVNLSLDDCVSAAPVVVSCSRVKLSISGTHPRDVCQVACG